MSGPHGNAEPVVDPEAVVRAYLEAFQARDLDRCLTFFSEDAVIDFQSGSYAGPKAIADWHRDRFAADLKVIRLDSIQVTGDSAIVDVVVSSKRLAAWKINALNARITVRFHEGKFQGGKMAPRMMNPIDLWRSGQ